MSRYKTEILTSKEVSNKWGIPDTNKIANEIELLLNQYNELGYSLSRLEWLPQAGIFACLLVFEKYDFTKE